jgi:hypothetical protein
LNRIKCPDISQFKTWFVGKCCISVSELNVWFCLVSYFFVSLLAFGELLCLELLRGLIIPSNAILNVAGLNLLHDNSKEGENNALNCS